MSKREKNLDPSTIVNAGEESSRTPNDDSVVRDAVQDLRGYYGARFASSQDNRKYRKLTGGVSGLCGVIAFLYLLAPIRALVAGGNIRAGLLLAGFGALYAFAAYRAWFKDDEEVVEIIGLSIIGIFVSYVTVNIWLLVLNALLIPFAVIRAYVMYRTKRDDVVGPGKRGRR